MIDTSHKAAIEGRRNSEAERVAAMIAQMDKNKAYIHAYAANGDADGTLLEEFRARYRWYRESWQDLPRQAIKRKLVGEKFREAGNPPLCVDVEVAAVCDLACPFCFRQHLATPDKIMEPALVERIIDEAVKLGVPSMKFNWRGEPLLNPCLPDFIDRAKRKGILETLINTNATNLDETLSRRLIEAGLDLMIYSFDGGSKQSYEHMRPGRFRKNSFDHVYGNIRRFAEIKKEMGAQFPRTKIQMILTEETFDEQDSFFALFEDCVDDVSVKQYTERGAGLSDLDPTTRSILATEFTQRQLANDTAYLRDMKGNLHIAVGREPCAQPFQRLLVTYDGKVVMCCYDWVARHTVGFVDDSSFAEPELEYTSVFTKAQAGANGFEPLVNVRMPERFNAPQNKVSLLKDIWFGPEIDRVRKAHIEDRANEIEVCKTCPFKETFQWEKVRSVVD